MGSFTLGFVGEGKKGPQSRWTMNPYVFDNDYYKELILGNDSPYVKTGADLKLMETPDLKMWVENYAEDSELFFKNYAKAHVKLSERTYDSLYSEFTNSTREDGFQEIPLYRIFIDASRGILNGDPETEQWADENI